MNEALLAHATVTIKVGSKSFAAAARLFAPEIRRSVLMLYAWCRHCDDVVDGQELGFAAGVQDAASAASALARLEQQTSLAFTGAPMQEPAFAAFQEVALRCAIAPRYAFDHLAGFAMDVQEARYETLDDTLRYCYHVAGVVGLMMATIMGAKAPAVLDRACDLGIAFQLTNIARDIVDDAKVGRCYLPAQWLREAGIAQDELASERHRAKLAAVAARLVEQAEPYYMSATEGLAALPLRSAWAIATAHRVYRQIGIEVRARGAQAWDKRVGTSRATKLWLLCRGGIDALASRFRTASAVRCQSLWQRPAHGTDGHVTNRHAAPATAV